MPPATAEAPTETASTDLDIFALAKAADEGTPVETSTPAKPAPASQESTSTTAASVESAQTKAEKSKPESKPADKTETPSKPETPYQKSQKEAERREKSWKALEAEKAQVRAEAQQIAASKAEIEQLRRQVQELRTPVKPPADAAGNTAEIYDQLAIKYAEEGDTKMAKLAQEHAVKLRSEAGRAPAEATPTATATTGEAWKTPEFQTEWQRHTAELLAADPTLNDPQHPLTQATQALVNDKQWAPYFRANPAGIKAALEVAKIQQIAARVPTLEKDLAAKTTEIERLNKLTQPRRGGPAPTAPGEIKLTDMSTGAAEAHVRAMAAAADRGA